MIILDSNILKGTSLRSPEAELLRTLHTVGDEGVVAPWIVLEELAAQQALIYQEKYEAAASAVAKLNKATPWETVRPPRQATPEQVRKHWRKRYSEIVGTLQTSPTAYKKAMYREANLLAPCKTVNSGKDKTGARDAAIWLTAVEYARDHPSETTYFVSNNTKDFGDGTYFAPPMDEDIKGIEDRFVLFTSLDDVLTKFATESSIPETELTGLLKMERNQASIVDTVEKKSRYHRFRATTIGKSSGQLEEIAVRRLVRAAVALGSVTDIHAREIGGHKWCTATVRWFVSAFARTVAYPGDVYWVCCAWETRVLVSPTAPSEGLNILRDEGLSPITREDLLYLAAFHPDFLVEGNKIADHLTSIEREMPHRTPAELRDLLDHGALTEDVDLSVRAMLRRRLELPDDE
ncbi:PIN domain-containing protein [Streptomyces sp. NBC_01727]|uniref:PIN domain-containing protein n=1 Tax=Streptomyces sp. NBC_01727 TaxID=2975924 RepID=UPI002E14E9E7|nr:PIN domain-containing protein [Streptomyces sp. NBC_01727]